MSKALMTLMDDSLAIEKALIESYGEMTREIADRLIINEIETKEKLDGYNVMIDRFEINEQFFKSKADQIYLVASAFKNARALLRDRIKEFMIATKKDELFGSDFRFQLQNVTPKLEIDEKLIEEKYKYDLVTRVIDKDKIKADLKADIEVKGAKLEQGRSMKKYNLGAKK